jgi:hypothetical protein
MEPNTVPFDYCHKWIKASIKIGERHYTLLLMCGLLVFASSFIVGLFPYVGNFCALFLTFIYGLAGMRLTQQILKQGSGTFDDYLKYAFDPVVFKKFQPFLVIIFLMATLQVTSGIFKITTLLYFSSVTSYLFITLFMVSAFLLLQQPSIGWQDAFKKVLSGFWQNGLTWVAAGFLMAIFAVVSALLCFVPFLLYFIPMTFSLAYLIYASIFEDLNIDALISEWSSKVVTTTILDPSSTSAPSTPTDT